MKKEIAIRLDVVDPAGEMHEVNAVLREHYNTPKGINAKMKVESFAERQAYVCRGPGDIRMWGYLMTIADRQNQFRNPAKIAKDADWDYSRLNKLLKRGIEAGAWKRIGRGEYLWNPYMFVSRGASNKAITELQKEHPTWPTVRDGKIEKETEC